MKTNRPILDSSCSALSKSIVVIKYSWEALDDIYKFHTLLVSSILTCWHSGLEVQKDLSKQSVAPSRVKLKLAELIPAAHSGSASSGPRSSAAQTFAQDRGRSTVVPSMFDLVSHQLRLMCTDIWLASEVPPPYHYEIDLVLRSERVR